MISEKDYERYVGPENLEKIREQDLQLIEGEKHELTVMLADVRDFTSFSEKNSSREVINLLNKYFDRIVQTVFEYGGAIDKFMGDCVMAVFGVPAVGLLPEGQGHALTAVECALQCRQTIREFSQQRADQGKPTLKVGYTLNSGRALAGHFGSSVRKDYSVVGDMVNTCARIEKFVEEDGILVGQETYSLVRDNVHARKKPPTRVKGKQELVHIYKIMEMIDNG